MLRANRMQRFSFDREVLTQKRNATTNERDRENCGIKKMFTVFPLWRYGEFTSFDCIGFDCILHKPILCYFSPHRETKEKIKLSNELTLCLFSNWVIKQKTSSDEYTCSRSNEVCSTALIFVQTLYFVWALTSWKFVKWIKLLFMSVVILNVLWT